MSDYESVARRLREANPVPAVATLQEDELQAVRALLDRRRGIMASALPATARARRWQRPAIAVGAAFVVTLAAVGTTLALLSRGEEAPPITSLTTTVAPTTTTPAPTTTVAPPTTTTTTLPPTTTTVPSFPDALGMTWTRVPDQEALHGGWISGAIAGGSGFVAVGGSMGAWDAAVWLSTDGLTWERIYSPSFTGEVDQWGSGDGEQWMADVVQGPQGLVAVGGDSQTGAAVWTSPDGRTWTRVPDDPEVLGVGGRAAYAVNFMTKVVAAGPGLVAIGATGALPRPNSATIWASADGTEWQQVFSSPAGEEVTWLGDIATWEGRLYVVGNAGYDDRSQPELYQPYHPVVLVSDDGLNWRTLPQAAAPGEPGVDYGASWPDVSSYLDAVAADQGELVGVGSARFPAAWRSTDGEAWARAQGRFVDFPADGGGPGDLIAHGGRLLIVANGAEIWGSADHGTFWFRVARFPLSEGAGAPGGPALSTMAPVGYIERLLPVGDAVMAFGHDAVYSSTEDIGGDVCWTGVMQCRADAAIWIGTFDQG